MAFDNNDRDDAPVRESTPQKKKSMCILWKRQYN